MTNGTQMTKFAVTRHGREHRHMTRQYRTAFRAKKLYRLDQPSIEEISTIKIINKHFSNSYR